MVFKQTNKNNETDETMTNQMRETKKSKNLKSPLNFFKSVSCSGFLLVNVISFVKGNSPRW